MERHRLVHAHFAPSCGTASRARERPVPGLSAARQPRPLRSEDKPDGLPSLGPAEQVRVESANASYAAMVKLILVLVDLGVSISIENPKNSLFWLASWMQVYTEVFLRAISRFSTVACMVVLGTRRQNCGRLIQGHQLITFLGT